jgi:hypothetical protein
METTSHISCFSKKVSPLSKEDIVKSPRQEIVKAEKNIIQSILMLAKKENMPELVLCCDSISINV